MLAAFTDRYVAITHRFEDNAYFRGTKRVLVQVIRDSDFRERPCSTTFRNCRGILKLRCNKKERRDRNLDREAETLRGLP